MRLKARSRKLNLIEIATSVHDLVLLPQVGKTFNYLQRQTLHNSTAKAQIIWYCQRSIRNLALVWRPEHEISGRGVKATHSNADFAKDLLWDLACFLQWLVQGATILWTTDGDKWRGFKIKICEKQHISSKIACYHADQAVNGGQEIPNNFQYSL